MSQPSFVVDHATKDARARPEPVGAGFFGQRGTIEAHIAENRAEEDRPTLEQFEDHYGHFGMLSRKVNSAG